MLCYPPEDNITFAIKFLDYARRYLCMIGTPNLSWPVTSFIRPFLMGRIYEVNFISPPQFHVDILSPYFSTVPTSSQPVASLILPLPLDELGDFTVQYFELTQKFTTVKQ